MMAMLAKRVVEGGDGDGGGGNIAAPDRIIPPVPQQETSSFSAVISQEVLSPSPSTVDPRKAMMDVLKKREIHTDKEYVKGGESVVVESGSKVIQLKNCLTYSKYFKMLKVGLPEAAVAHKMLSEGAVGTIDSGLELLSLGAEVSKFIYEIVSNE